LLSQMPREVLRGGIRGGSGADDSMYDPDGGIDIS
jgi:hypothetical protein